MVAAEMKRRLPKDNPALELALIKLFGGLLILVILRIIWVFGGR